MIAVRPKDVQEEFDVLRVNEQEEVYKKLYKEHIDRFGDT